MTVTELHPQSEVLKVGASDTFVRTFSKEMQKAFREITGDTSPQHLGPTADCPDGPIVYASLITQWVGETIARRFPGGLCWFVKEIDAKFRGPVYVGEEAQLTLKIATLRFLPDRTILSLEIAITSRKEKAATGSVLLISVVA